MRQTREVLFNLLILPLERNIGTICGGKKYHLFMFPLSNNFLPVYPPRHLSVYIRRYFVRCQFNIESNKPTCKAEREVGNLTGMIKGEMEINDSRSNIIEGNST
jgi:hypothetical protein